MSHILSTMENIANNSSLTQNDIVSEKAAANRLMMFNSISQFVIQFNPDLANTFHLKFNGLKKTDKDVIIMEMWTISFHDRVYAKYYHCNICIYHMDLTPVTSFIVTDMMSGVRQLYRSEKFDAEWLGKLMSNPDEAEQMVRQSPPEGWSRMVFGL